MASVNTTSVREEITRIEEDLARLGEQGKLSEESRVLFRSLLMIVNMLVTVFMEKNTRKNSKNSSIPSSQTEKDNSSTEPRSNGRGLAEKDKPFDNCRIVETEQVAPVNRCTECGQSLSKILATDHERRTRIDILFEKRVEHVDAEIKQCPCCDHINKGQLFDVNYLGRFRDN